MSLTWTDWRGIQPTSCFRVPQNKNGEQPNKQIFAPDEDFLLKKYTGCCATQTTANNFAATYE